MKKKPINKMTAIVNPFTRTVRIIHTVGKETYELDLTFEDLDEWQGFDGVDKQYDIHFYYEDYTHEDEDTGETVEYKGGFDLSVYPVVKNQTDTQNPIKVEVKISYEILGKKKKITYICPNKKR